MNWKKIMIIVFIALTVLTVVFYLFRSTSTVYGNISYGPNERHQLDIAIPNQVIKENKKVPVLLYIHGGGWSAGDKSDFAFMREATTNLGYIYVSINYQLTTSGAIYTDMLLDIDLAIQFLYDHAEEYYIDTTKMALLGSSAGAHLAMLYGYKMTDASAIPITLVVSQVGPSDLSDINYFSESIDDSVVGMASALTGVDVVYENYANGTFDPAILDASPVTHLTYGKPATILAYGMLDHLVPYSNATTIKNALDSYGIPNELITFANSGHALTANLDQASFDLYQTKLVEYLENYLPKS